MERVVFDILPWPAAERVIEMVIWNAREEHKRKLMSIHKEFRRVTMNAHNFKFQLFYFYNYNSSA